MSGTGRGDDPAAYPRNITPLERDLIEWVLPPGSPGYLAYRDFIGGAVVIGEGRRGEGEIILGKKGTSPDFGSPLGPVYSFGVAETADDLISVTIREMENDQVSVEIVGRKSDAVAEDACIIRKWTYANWKPGQPCPQCAGRVREVPVVAGTEPSARAHTLAVCVSDRRLWVFDGAGITSRPIPLTNYYNELMLLKNIRDPGIALDGKKLFEHLARYTDGELAAAFLAYNRLKTKISDIGPDPADSRPKEGVVRKLLGKLTR